MRKILLTFSLVVAFGLILSLVLNLELITYGISQGKGQFGIIINAKDVSDVLEDPNMHDSIKSRLRLVNSVKGFAYEDLGLDQTDIYSSINTEKDKYSMYVVTASEPFSLTPKTWSFPVAGEVPYKGFFNLNKAVSERNSLSEQGWDGGIRIAGGWSTLGWFENPLLLKMLEREIGDFINLVIHEMAHETLYVPGNTELNENLATFIGDWGTLLYLETEFGLESEVYASYVTDEEDYEKYAEHFLNGTAALDSLYGQFHDLEERQKVKLKYELIREIVDKLDTISFNNKDKYKEIFGDTIPNNTYFLSFKRYRSTGHQFQQELFDDFDGEIKKYLEALKKRYGKQN